MKKRGFFITLEGTDGVGKTTHSARLAEWLRSRGYTVERTREPGGGKVAEKIRQILLDPELQMENLTELFLYEAARIEHLHAVVLPALKAGKILICDRFTDSTVAYQGYGRGLLRSAVRLNDIATGGLRPDLTILLDLPPREGLAKAISRNKKGGDRLENEGVAFQVKVALGFRALARKEPRRVKVVRVQASIEKTQKLIQHVVSKTLHVHPRPAARPALSR